MSATPERILAHLLIRRITLRVQLLDSDALASARMPVGSQALAPIALGPELAGMRRSGRGRDQNLIWTQAP